MQASYWLSKGIATASTLHMLSIFCSKKKKKEHRNKVHVSASFEVS
jgi:hypothetical protein